MEIAFSKKLHDHWIDEPRYYSFKSVEKLIQYLFPKNIKVSYNNSNPDCILNAMLYRGNYKSGEDGIEVKKKLNILLCVENCIGHPITNYTHYYKFRDYGDPRINLYFYNHIDRCVFNEQYIAIPLIFTQIDYFNRFYTTIKPTCPVPFQEKKFCLITTVNGYRSNVKQEIIKRLEVIGPCDYLTMYRPGVENESCYHSEVLLNIIQKYKFVFVCENSIADGYITEKIFNGFFGRAIPIYNGSHAIERYFKKDAFINANDLNNLSQITTIMNDEATFQRMIAAEKVMPFDNQDYPTKLQEFIEKIFA
jgi:hypothetical protein